ncbi:VOC family protein [Sphingomonas sp. SM33]|uniref:VOC family protein n=1 Tax=Sphingomonas telluris TaxID=2907998 RepID=A0ABS9VQ53_9SPHN|nr:VOC family protein [Sphingomonas telluris]MCH8617077.1 VOC family protein [Sphingomonas telluris]
MTDVRDAAASTQDSASSDTGGFIWYELMTPDPDGAKAFYDAVVGWDIGEGSVDFNGYRMIGRKDGGFAGGVLPLNDEMQQHGARPTWLGYIHVADVDQSLSKLEAAGGKALMPAMDIPNVGRIAMVTDPQGNPFYIMKPIPPQGDPNAQSDVFSLDAEQRVGWNELMTSDPVAARQFYGQLFGWTSDDFMPMGENGEYRFWARQGAPFGAVCKEMGSGSSKWRYYFRVPSISAAVEAVKSGGGQVSMGPHEVPGADYIIIGNDPQGAEFALVGKA